MNKRQLEILGSPGFLLGLSLLLLNDFFLKPLFANWFTGKLSDFAGLFIFPIFWAALFPRRKKIVFAATAIVFVVWKSAWSQPFIDYWNEFLIWPISRTIDAGDLVALLVLPISYRYFNQPRQLVRKPVALYLTAAVAVFAFTATSYVKRTQFDFGNRYDFPMNRTSLLRKMYQLDRTIPDYSVSTCSRNDSQRNNFELQLPSTLCGGPIKAEITTYESQTQTTVTLQRMETNCAGMEDDKQKVQEVFENEFVAKINHLNVDSTLVSADELSAADPALKDLQIYLVPFNKRTEGVAAILTKDFKDTFDLKITQLPAPSRAVSAPCESTRSGCPDAEGLLAVMEDAYPRVAKNQKAIMVGFVDDMTVSDPRLVRPCSYRSTARTAIISLDSLDPVTYCELQDDELLQKRLRRALENEIVLLGRMLREPNPAQSHYLNFNGCAYILNQK